MGYDGMMIDKRAHERLDVVEKDLRLHREEHRKFEASLRENTELTKQIEANTGELVTLFKGVSSVRTFFIWASPIAAAIAGIVAFISWVLGKN